VGEIDVETIGIDLSRPIDQVGRELANTIAAKVPLERPSAFTTAFA
jgi:hypothetical protein